MFDDRPRCTESVRTDPEHDRIAAAKHARGVREHIRTSLEDEADDAEAVSHLVDPPAVVADRLGDAPPATGCIPPGPQSFDHVGSHPIAQFEACRRPASGSRTGYVRPVSYTHLTLPTILR